MEDELFDNGIDGKPWGKDQAEASAEDYSDAYYEDGGIYLHQNTESDTKVVYFCGQWNDSGVDPDRIGVECDTSEFEDKGYSVYFEKDYAWIKVPGRKSFQLKMSFQLSDFVDVQSPVPIVMPYTGIADLQDALSAKKVQIIFDKEKFKAKLERYKNLLVFS